MCVGFRIGLVFVVSDEDDIDGMQDAGVALVRAYNYISDEVDSQSAFEAVISVSRPFTNTDEELVLHKTPIILMGTLSLTPVTQKSFCTLFCHLIFSLLISFQMFNRVPIGGQLSVGDVMKVLEKRFPYVEVSSVLGADSSYDSNRKVREDECDDTVLDSTSSLWVLSVKKSIIVTISL